MAIRNWPARYVLVAWAAGLIAIIVGLPLLIRIGGPDNEALGLRSDLFCLVFVWAPALITCRWFAALPHAKWRPPKLYLLWGCLLAAIFALYAFAQAQQVMDLFYVLAPPCAAIVVVITWTWLTAREQAGGSKSSS